MSKASAIAELLPHSGAMCLLQSVQHWDEQGIECRASSHLDLENPLRKADCLPVSAGIEYLAQAMAIHGTLCERREGQPRAGYLAVLTDVDWHCERLDNLSGELRVCAEKLSASAGGFIYRFFLRHGEQLLLQGQALVALRDLES